MEEKKKKRYSAEVRDQAVRLLREALKDHAFEWGAIAWMSSKVGCSGETLRGWLRQAERDGMTAEDRELKVARRATGMRSCARRAHILLRCGPQGAARRAEFDRPFRK